jgi:hypothetical protein
MQHLLLALSIITLLLIAGDDREKTAFANSSVPGKMKEPVVNNTVNNFLPDETSVSFSRFDMFVY